MAVSSVSHRTEDIFTYPFSDPKSSKKLLIGILLMLANLVIPILPLFVVIGYSMEIRRRLVLKGNLEMPDWGDWGRYFKDGAKAFAIGLLFMLPVVFIALLGFAIVLLPGILLDVDVIGQSEASPGNVLITGILSLAGLIVCGLVILLCLILGFVLPAAVTHFAVKGYFSAAFNISEWWPILRNNISDFVIAYIILIVIGIFSALISQVLSFTIVLCLLVPILLCAVSVYTMFLTSGLFAKAYLGGLEKYTEGKSGLELEAA